MVICCSILTCCSLSTTYFWQQHSLHHDALLYSHLKNYYQTKFYLSGAALDSSAKTPTSIGQYCSKHMIFVISEHNSIYLTYIHAPPIRLHFTFFRASHLSPHCSMNHSYPKAALPVSVSWLLTTIPFPTNMHSLETENMLRPRGPNLQYPHRSTSLSNCVFYQSLVTEKSFCAVIYS